MNTVQLKTRFAPSPTGEMHAGNARTALFSFLAAQQAQGCFLLRIEDSDLQRSQVEYVQQLLDDLTWLGLNWQEGAAVGGSHGPYFQSERLEIYAQYFQKLIDLDRAYPCFCSEAELEQTRMAQLAKGRPPRYAGTCAHLSADEVAAKFAQDLKPTLRFRIPAAQKIEFNDLVKGPQSFHSHDIGDFIIRKTDGMPTFMFCNAIDDSLMQVSHVLRGADHLTNTPRQIMILQALQLAIPAYGHLPLIVIADGAKMSKRHGSLSIQQLRQAGYLAPAIVNYLARLGHNFPENLGLASLDQLAANFSWQNLGKSPANYDESQLKYWQKLAVSQLDLASFSAWLAPAALAQIPAPELANFVQVIQPNVVFPDEAKVWANIIFGGNLDFAPENLAILQAAGPDFFLTAANLIATSPAFDEFKSALQKQTGLSGPKLFKPLRLALTGRLDGPELRDLFKLLGLAKIKQRFQTASTLC